MLGFIGFLMLACIGFFVALTVNGIIVASRGRFTPPAVYNQEMFVVQEPAIAQVPKRPVADSHWHIKTFMRPRRKKV